MSLQNDADTIATKIRSSQRAPRSCMRCARKRTKCDKNIPCQTCTTRGLEASCTREVVRVKGRLIVGGPSESQSPTYSDLLEENRRLKAALESSFLPPKGQTNSSWPYGETPTITEAFENDVHLAILDTKRSSTVRSLSEICLPSARCSYFLLEHGLIWTSWIHFAIHIPTFRLEHNEYWTQSEQKPILERDPFWLAIYFSFLSVTLIFLDDGEAISAGLPHALDNIVALLENWYHTSLFFLDQAEYLRRHDMRTVQTIAVLLGLYKNMGDSLHSTHLACAIRIAQTLHLDDDALNASRSLLENEVRRRVWWTLIICEWLQRPNGPSFASEFDFDVALPLVLDDEELMWQSSACAGTIIDLDRPRPVQYHLAMIAIAKLWHRFRSSLVSVRQDPDALETLVLRTDEALANIINDLPLHLQEDCIVVEVERKQPWIPWQRNNLSLSILYYRMAINRVLQDQWVQSPNSYARTQAICLGSAKAIVSLVHRSTAPARNRPWAIASNLFSAAITIAVEAKFSDSETAAAYVHDVRRCIKFLSAIRDRNVVAARAIEVLNSCLLAPDLTSPVLN